MILTLKDGFERLSRNVGNCQPTLRNIPEERKSENKILREILIITKLHSCNSYSYVFLGYFVFHSFFFCRVLPQLFFPATVGHSSDARTWTADGRTGFPWQGANVGARNTIAIHLFMPPHQILTFSHFLKP